VELVSGFKYVSQVMELWVDGRFVPLPPNINTVQVYAYTPLSSIPHLCSSLPPLRSLPAPPAVEYPSSKKQTFRFWNGKQEISAQRCESLVAGGEEVASAAVSGVQLLGLGGVAQKSKTKRAAAGSKRSGGCVSPPPTRASYDVYISRALNPAE